MKFLPLVTCAALFLPTFAHAGGPNKKDSAKFNIPVAVLGSSIYPVGGMFSMDLIVRLEGRCEEWRSAGSYGGVIVLKPGTYMASREERSSKAATYDATYAYQLLLPDGRKQDLSVVAVGASVAGNCAATGDPS